MKTADLTVAAKLFRGLSDVSRLRVLAVLRDGPLRVGEIVARTRLTQPNTSMHLACLADCGLVGRERRGRFVQYSIADKRVVRLVDEVEELLLDLGPRVAACPRYRELAPPLGRRRRQGRDRR